MDNVQVSAQALRALADALRQRVIDHEIKGAADAARFVDDWARAVESLVEQPKTED